jgi:hypothetical protein
MKVIYLGLVNIHSMTYKGLQGHNFLRITDEML